VRIVKNADAPAVRYVSGDDPTAAAAIRELDLQKKYHLSPQQLADQLQLSTSKAKALRGHLGIDDDARYVHVFEFGSQKHPRYSDNAMRALKEVYTPALMEQAWAARPRPKARGAN